MFYVEVEDIAAHIESMESRGGQVMVPESGSFAWCKDPNGNLFGLWIPAH
jgi:predicted enzyme related to lactoylglutathione lyase